MNKEELQKLLDKCMSELELAHQGECQPERAEKNAALFLKVQIKLAEYLVDAELQAKAAKNEIERLSAEKYFEYKSGPSKMTEAALDAAVSKDETVCKVKSDMIGREAEYKKWNYVYNTLTNAHVLFRGMGKKELF